MKVAKPSLSHRSSNQRMVTRSPNHWCATSCRIGREPAEPAGQGRPLAEDEAVLAVEDRAGMLHAAEGKRRREHEVELLERVRPPEVALHPVERAAVEREQRVQVRLPGAGAADVGVDRAAALRRAHPMPRPRGEGDEVGADRLGLGEPRGDPPARRVRRSGRSVGDGQPGGRRRERQRHARLQVGLVEAGKELARVGGDEQGVEVVAAVGRVVTPDDARAGRRDVGDEPEVELVLAGAKQAGRDDRVAVTDGGSR